MKARRRFCANGNPCCCIYEQQPANQDNGSNCKNNTICCCTSKFSINVDDVSLVASSSSAKSDSAPTSCCCCQNNLERARPRSIAQMPSRQNSVLQNDYCELCIQEYEACQIPNCQDCLVADLEMGGIRATGDLPRPNDRFIPKEIRKLRKKLAKRKQRRRTSVKRFVMSVLSLISWSAFLQEF